jgi:predicted nucleic acid-binding Zn ribbon protein
MKEVEQRLGGGQAAVDGGCTTNCRQKMNHRVRRRRIAECLQYLVGGLNVQRIRANR